MIETISALIEQSEYRYYKTCKELGVKNPITFKTLMVGYTIVGAIILAFLVYSVVV